MGNMWKESTKRGGVNDAGEEVDEEEETRRGFLTVDVDKMEGEAADNLDLSLEMEVYGVKEIEGGGRSYHGGTGSHMVTDAGSRAGWVNTR